MTIGALAFPQGTLGAVVLVGVGVSLGPAAVVGVLFRVFLFGEVQHQLTQPVIDEVKDRLGPEIREQVTTMVGEYRGIIAGYREEIEGLQAIKDAGVVRPYRSRMAALRDFAAAIDAETTEISVVGSSLKGLLQKDEYNPIADKLRLKIGQGNVRVKFLLTHPVIADLRAEQEARQFTEIGKEIILTLRTLRQWGVPPENVRLYRGTPTCFAIKTARRMLLNPYPYGSVAYESPCLIVETSEDHPSYFYTKFNESHFGAGDTSVVAQIQDYDRTIKELETNLAVYAKMVGDLLKA